MKHYASLNRTSQLSLLAIVCLIMISSCGTPRPYYQSGESSRPDTVDSRQVDYSVFLIGDTGRPVLNGTDPVLEALENQLQAAGDSSSVIFLGDNIYQTGMNPDTTYAARQEDEAIITRNLETLENYGGNAFFLPGNHDWYNGERGIIAQERFIENYSGADAEFEPSNGCPGPVGFDASEKWYIIMLDSEWWINRSYNPLLEGAEDCEYSSRVDVMNRMAEMAEEHSDKHVLISFHHPLYSNGSHGGFYTFRDHVFPLTNLNSNLYLPLPLIGSIYPIYRKLGRSPQDINHQQYQEFSRQLREKVEDVDNVFFAAGHEHSLGFYQKEKTDEDKEGTDHFILSGSGSKTSYARTGYGSEFVYSHKGFAKLISYEDGSVTVEFWVPDDENPMGELVYYKQIIEPETQDVIEKIKLRREDYAGTEDTLRTIQAGPGYEAGKFHRLIWGDHYRDAWTAEVDVPVFDLDTKKGGIEVLDVTGGEQTITIIVQDSSENRYVMRSVQKNPAKSLPEVLQQTFVTGIAQDQTSASHPYGALIVPELANAAGVYQTDPEVGFISKKSGIKMDVGDKEGAVVSFEEFVSKDWFNNQYNKNAVGIISSDDLWERTRRGGDVEVDEHQLIRSRIFDMYIGDWDRHEGQWFWAETRTDSISVFEPIPIDRDNAFFMSDGAIPWLGRRQWALRKFQLFDEGIRDIAGMNFNGRYFDRWFMNEQPREEWIKIAEEMKQALTDSVINEAISQWPQPIQEINGETFRRKLQQRRDKLTEFATRYYDILASEVNVYGSDRRDRFEVVRKDSGRTVVQVYELGEDESKRTLRYERTFLNDETDEVRLFGFADDDEFVFEGYSDQAVTIRLVGGEGMDTINDGSVVKGASEKTVVYDTDYGSRIVNNGGEIELHTSDDPRINRFDNRAFEYDLTAPLISAGYNSDDGIFLGGGTLIKTHGFRKEPFAAKHRITAKRSLQTSSFAFNYNGVFTNEVGPLNLTLDAEVLAPKFVTNYFGIGNETERNVDDYDYYDYQMDNVDVGIGVAEGLKELLFVNAGVGYEFFRPRFSADNYITSPESELTDENFQPHHFANLLAGLRVTTVDDPMIPHYGAEFTASGELNVGLNGGSKSFGRIKSQFTGYYTFDQITTTLSSRLGFATNIGGYNFFQANTLGGQGIFTRPGNLRGYARSRFAGRTSLYHNTELRTKLGNFSSYLFPAKFGVTAFFDEGRVWSDDESSKMWHMGYGGGVWISPLDFFVVNATYARSVEDNFISVTLGFSL